MMMVWERWPAEWRNLDLEDYHRSMHDTAGTQEVLKNLFSSDAPCSFVMMGGWRSDVLGLSIPDGRTGSQYLPPGSSGRDVWNQAT